MKNISRRSFSAALAAAPALAQTPAPAPQISGNPDPGQRRGTVPEVPPFDGPLAFTRRDVPLKAEPFPMSQVRLLDGPFKQAETWNRGYMQRLPADRLVHNFRLTAGLPSSATSFGGWEKYVAPGGPRTSSDGELRGHFTGHFLSASAQYAVSGDKEARAKGDEMVDALAKCQQKLGAGGYLGAFPTEWFDRLSARQPVWAPFYTIHKIMAGMFDMYHLAGNKQALSVLEGMSNWADEWTASKTEQHMQEILKTEYGGMGETLYNLAAATNNDRWAKAGDRFSKKSFFNPLASRRDELRGLHVNTHIPQVLAAARRYEISGDYRFHDVADYFWWEVTSARSYVTNGTSTGEGWLAQPRQMSVELKRSADTAECCCAYNMLKLTRHLYQWNPDPSYFDYYERTLLNHRLGTILPDKGYTQYYLSLYPGAWKTFNTEDQSFWCCTGTGVEEYSKLNDSIYWRDHAGVYVNLFIPSELNWEEKGFQLRQDTQFPLEASTTLTVTASRPAPVTIRLRIPQWLDTAPTVKINGKVLEASAEPGSYLALNRTWKTGDRIEMALPMHLTMESTPDKPNLQAYLYGPLVLAGELGSDGLTEQLIIGPEGPRPNSRGLSLEIPGFRATTADLSTWIKPTGKPLTFRTANQPKDVTLAPLNSIFGSRYNVYWQVS